MTRTAEDRVDVLVVGAGPSGAIISHTLAARGFSVVCLEQGDWVNTEDYPTNFPEWELQAHRRWSHVPNNRRLPADYPVNADDSDISPAMFNAVGGSTIAWGAQWPRLVPSDFRVYSTDGVADDWPIGYSDLVPYYDEVDRFIGVAGLGGNPAYPEGLDYPQPPHPLGKVGRTAALGMNRLGYQWWPGTNCIPTVNTPHLARCVRYGVCTWGCPAGSKASFDLAYWPAAMNAGAKLTVGARVQRLVLTRDGLVDGAEWIDRDGQIRFQAAGATVLCANGIGTPRLLLLSADARHPDGLANSSGLVGRNLMLHPNSSVSGFYDMDLESWLGPLGELISSHQFYETHPDHHFVRGAKLHGMPTVGVMLNSIDMHRRLNYDDVWGAAVHEVARAAGRGILWGSNAEDLPEEHNRVTLDHGNSDSDGLPGVKVEYRISENTRRIMSFAIDRMREIHEASGAVRIITTELWEDEPGHLLGTARMGADPSKSVVDQWGRTHDVGNLHIADGSIFVTAGAANPTATICALALRIGRHLADQAPNQVASS